MHQIWHDYTISTVKIWSYHYTALQYNQYNLCKENDEGRIRTLHRNLLVPIGYIRDIYQHLLQEKCFRNHKFLPKEPLDIKLRNWNTQELMIIQLIFHRTTSQSTGIVISQEEPVDSDSTITDEPLVQQTDEISEADDEDTRPSTDTVNSANEDETRRKCFATDIR
jgi:hypothetical protein